MVVVVSTLDPGSSTPKGRSSTARGELSTGRSTARGGLSTGRAHGSESNGCAIRPSREATTASCVPIRGPVHPDGDPTAWGRSVGADRGPARSVWSVGRDPEGRPLPAFLCGRRDRSEGWARACVTGGVSVCVCERPADRRADRVEDSGYVVHARDEEDRHDDDDERGDDASVAHEATLRRARALDKTRIGQGRVIIE